MKGLARIFSLAALMTPMAFATEYSHLQPENSQISFSYQQMGVAMTGKFKRFSAPELAIDPSKLEAARAQFDVEILSIDTGSSDNDAEAIGSAWLNSQAFQHARFVMSRLVAQGGNSYEASGQLTLKGHSQDVSVPVTLTEQGDGSALLEGHFTVKRADYAIGEGEWAAEDIVSGTIQVHFKLKMTSSQ